MSTLVFALPAELLLSILEYLDAPEIARLCSSISGWQAEYAPILDRALRSMPYDFWFELCKHRPLRLEFIMDHIKDISGYAIASNPNLTLELYLALPQRILPGLAYTLHVQNYRIDFLDHFASTLTWDYILRMYRHKEDVLRRFAHYFDDAAWEILSRPPYDHSASFLVDYREQLNWCVLSRRDWSPDIIKTHGEQLKHAHEIDCLLGKCYS